MADTEEFIDVIGAGFVPGIPGIHGNHRVNQKGEVVTIADAITPVRKPTTDLETETEPISPLTERDTNNEETTKDAIIA